MAAAIRTPIKYSTSLGVVSIVFGNKVKQRFAIELFHWDGIDSRPMSVERADFTRHLQI